MATVWNTDYIINITHHLRNAYSHALAYRWQLTMHSGRIWSVVTKSSQCFRKSCILDHPCIWWWSWLAVSSLDTPLEFFRSAPAQNRNCFFSLYFMSLLHVLLLFWVHANKSRPFTVPNNVAYYSKTHHQTPMTCTYTILTKVLGHPLL